MKRILVTAYDVNPFKGSESGMGWNFISQISKYNEVIAITRKNNQPHIDEYFSKNHPNTKLEFLYYDLPYWLRFWKKGSRGSSLYFYLWQVTIPIFILMKRVNFEVVHNLNFHTDWAPSVLWIFRKPMVWGPIGHHPMIPKQYLLRNFSLKAFSVDRLKGLSKFIFWNFDPLLWLTKRNSKVILCMNSSVTSSVHLQKEKTVIFPSVGSERFEDIGKKGSSIFNVLSVGRFVPLKGFDLTIQGFEKFYVGLSDSEKQRVSLTLVGTGDSEVMIRSLASQSKAAHAINFVSWLPRNELSCYFSQAAIFLFPSHEGAGMVVVEALAHATPVICLDNSGPGELITDDCGYKIQIDDYDKTTSEIAEGLSSLFQNPQKRTLMGDEALKVFETKYNWNSKGEVLKDIYENL